MTHSSNNDLRPEFSRLVNLSELVSRPRDYTCKATHSECEALCERLQIQGLENLEGKATLTLSSHAPFGVDGPCVNLQGSLSASVEQICVVTLEPIENTIETTFSGVFLMNAHEIELQDKEDEKAEKDEKVYEGPDILGEIISDSVDLGELFTEQLALELDPFPRKAGTNFDGYNIENKEENDGNTEDIRENPFAVLKKLKDNQE